MIWVPKQIKRLWLSPVNTLWRECARIITRNKRHWCYFFLKCPNAFLLFFGFGFLFVLLLLITKDGKETFFLRRQIRSIGTAISSLPVTYMRRRSTGIENESTAQSIKQVMYPLEYEMAIITVNAHARTHTHTTYMYGISL